jgi:hypothetical protein
VSLVRSPGIDPSIRDIARCRGIPEYHARSHARVAIGIREVRDDILVRFGVRGAEGERENPLDSSLVWYKFSGVSTKRCFPSALSYFPAINPTAPIVAPPRAYRPLRWAADRKVEAFCIFHLFLRLRSGRLSASRFRSSGIARALTWAPPGQEIETRR